MNETAIDIDLLEQAAEKARGYALLVQAFIVSIKRDGVHEATYDAVAVLHDGLMGISDDIHAAIEEESPNQLENDIEKV